MTGTRTIPTRIVPPPLAPGRAFGRLLTRNFYVYRRIWTVVFSGFFEPLFYLFSIGVGIGKLVGDVPGPNGAPVEYAVFVAPALLGSSAMNGAIYESTMNIFFKLKYGKIYDAVLSTPMQPLDIAIGEITWSLGRGALYAGGFLIVMASMGLIESAWGILALPAAVLIGFAFAACGMAATTYMRSWQDFDLVNLIVLPLFLFSGTFYPLSVYPPVFQVFTRFSPLYHSVELLRALTLGAFDWSLAGHIGFLVAMGAAGAYVTSRRLATLLMP
ncbi:MAG: ABC transporter permease [Actinobacteria bacterium]|nr:ABC transporter permease [Actinomycetota bacterium]